MTPDQIMAALARAKDFAATAGRLKPGFLRGLLIETVGAPFLRKMTVNYVPVVRRLQHAQDVNVWVRSNFVDELLKCEDEAHPPENMPPAIFRDILDHIARGKVLREKYAKRLHRKVFFAQLIATLLVLLVEFVYFAVLSRDILVGEYMHTITGLVVYVAVIAGANILCAHDLHWRS